MIPQTSELVTCELHDRIATVTLNRPDAHNALTRQMREDLAVLFGWIAEHRDDVRAVVLAGSGRSFCAGQDLKEGSDDVPAAEGLEAKFRGDFQTLLASLPQPTVAALHGYVLGRGVEVALTCDLRVAADNAQIGFPETALGMIPASGGTARLPRIVGPARALHLILTGERIDAATAEAWGLVTRVVPADTLGSMAQELAEKLAGQAPLAVQYARRVVLDGVHLSMADALRLEGMLSSLLRTTEDRQEGIRAFREKRAPRFQGR